MVAVVKATLMVTVFLRPRERSPMLTPLCSPSRRSSATACGGNHQTCILLEGFFDARDLPTISAQHFIPPCITKNSLLRWKRLTWTSGYRLDETRYRYAPSGRKAGKAEAFYHRLTQCKNVRQPVNSSAILRARMNQNVAQPRSNSYL